MINWGGEVTSCLFRLLPDSFWTFITFILFLSLAGRPGGRGKKEVAIWESVISLSRSWLFLDPISPPGFFLSILPFLALYTFPSFLLHSISFLFLPLSLCLFHSSFSLSLLFPSSFSSLSNSWLVVLLFVLLLSFTLCFWFHLLFFLMSLPLPSSTFFLISLHILYVFSSFFHLFIHLLLFLPAFVQTTCVLWVLRIFHSQCASPCNWSWCETLHWRSF